jgi:hypothetical protein
MTGVAVRVYVGFDTEDSVGNISLTAGDYFEAAEVQLEVGDTATPFEHEPYSVTLQKCLRYFELIGAADSSTYITQSTAAVYGNSTSCFGLPCKVEKRAYPTVTTGTLNFFTSSGWISSVIGVSASRSNAFFGLTGYTDNRLVRGYAIVDAEL